MQPKQNEAKSLEKCDWVGFLVANYSWPCSLPWSVVSRLLWGSIGNNRFFPLCHQVWIIHSFLVGWGAVHFMLQCCDPVRPCECSHSLWKFLRVSVLLSGRYRLLRVSPYLWLLQSFYVFFHTDSCALGGGSWLIPFINECSNISHSSSVVQLWVSVWVPI